LDLKSKQFLASEHFWAKKLPQGWRYEFFGDLIKDTIDNRGRTVPTSDFGIPLIATNCISNSSLFPVFKDIRYVSQKTHDEWFRDGHAEPNDIIFVNKGSPGHICLVPDPINFCFAQDMIGLKINHEKINFKYLFAILRTRFMQEQIDAFHVGTLIPHFKKSDFNSIVVPIPPKKLEDVVGEYYFSISQKIEKLENQNDTLEQMSQAIFQSWFVDFDGVTEFEDSELGQIPKGWQVKRLDKLFHISAGGDLSKISFSKIKSNEYKYPVYSNSLDNKGLYGFSKEYQYEPECVTITARGNVGRAEYRNNCFSAIVRLLVLKAKYDFLCSYTTHFINYKLDFSHVGSAVNQLTAPAISDRVLVVPSSNSLEKFNIISQTIFLKIGENQSQIDTLTKTRDILLPKLMSGEIRV
jgi:type I restriction enzyme, S subunit